MAGPDELLVHPNGVEVDFRDGLALVTIPVFTEQTGDVGIVVPFAIGSRDFPTGLVVATESSPRGPQAIVARWGEFLVAAAWGALMHTATIVAAGSGVDDANAVLLPGSLSTDGNALVVLPQARQMVEPGPGR